MSRFLFLFFIVPVLLFGCACGGAEGRNRSPLTVHRSRLADAERPAAVFAAAIRGRRPVAFVYNGVSRVAHPHRLGPSVAKNGKVLVRAWEVSRGGERSGTWKLFEVGKASGATLLPGTFEPAPGYTPRDRAIPAPTAEIEITKATKGETADSAD